MSKDCSLAEMATDKNAQRLSCLETGCTTREPEEEEEEGVTEGKREGVSRLRERKSRRSREGGKKEKTGEKRGDGGRGVQRAEEPRTERQVGDEHCRSAGGEGGRVRQSDRVREGDQTVFLCFLQG